MYYSEDFKNKCKRYFPKWKQLHFLLDAGDIGVGEILENSRETSLTLNDVIGKDIIAVVSHNSTVAQKKKELYNEWCSMFKEQFPSD